MCWRSSSHVCRRIAIFRYALVFVDALLLVLSLVAVIVGKCHNGRATWRFTLVDLFDASADTTQFVENNSIYRVFCRPTSIPHPCGGAQSSMCFYFIYHRAVAIRVTAYRGARVAPDIDCREGKAYRYTLETSFPLRRRSSRFEEKSLYNVFLTKTHKLEKRDTASSVRIFVVQLLTGA